MRSDRTRWIVGAFSLAMLLGCQGSPPDAESETSSGSRRAKIAATTDGASTTLTRTETVTQTATATVTVPGTAITTVTNTVTGTNGTTSTLTDTLVQTSTLTATGTKTVPTTVTLTQTGTATATASRTLTTVLSYQSNYVLTGTVTSTNTATVYHASWPRSAGTTSTATTTQIIRGTANKTVTGTVTSPYNGSETKTVTSTMRGSGTTTGVQTVTVRSTATATSTYAGTGSKTLTATGTATGTGTQSWTYHATSPVTTTITRTTTRTGTGTGTVTTSSSSTSSSTYTQSHTATGTGTHSSSETATATKTAVDTSTTTVTQTVTNTLTICGTVDGQPCPSGNYCDLDVGTCNTAGAIGVCRTVPTSCTDEIVLVCGCDGTSYDSACKAVLAGTSVSHSGACDHTAPTITLAVSGTLFTATGTLTLTATTTDDVLLAKVDFFQDGTLIGTVMAPPYALPVSVSNTLNGRHRYTATAYDSSGNSKASEAKRIFVAIGNKFFGTAATVSADYNNLLAHFNQVTPGNAGKWGTVEAVQGTMNFTDLDTAYNFAKANNLPFKLHTLVWGQQQPSWVAALPAAEQLAALDNWMTTLAARYPDVAMIDVVNEPLHAVPSYAAALGGAGTTGWDWVVKAFQMARAHFPKAELILNDYSVLPMASFTTNFVAIVNVLQQQDLIDGIGEQGHFYERSPDLSVIAANLATLAATGLPIYISELDLNLADDARQANRMVDLFTTFWTHPSVVGITHWGYLQGTMWQTNAYLIRSDGTLRPALTWIECFRAGGTNCTVPVYVPQPRTGDASGITLEAEDFDSAQGLLTAGSVVAYANDGSWFGFDKVVFDDNWNTLSVAYAQGGSNTINLTVHLGSLANAPVATVALPPTGGWSTTKTVSLPWLPITGQQNIVVRFNGGGANVDKLQFGAPAGVGKNLVTDNDFELGTTGGWSTWATPQDATTNVIANTTSRTLTGTHALAMTGRNGNSPLSKWLTSTALPGKTYKVSLWATIGGAATASAYVTTAIQCTTDTATTYGRLGGWENTKTISDGTWVELAGDLVVPDCTLSNVSIWLEGPGAGVDLYIDHVSFRQQSASNIVANGTFEAGTSGWYTWAGGTVSASTDRAHGGVQSLLVSTRASNAPAATDLTSVVKAGTNYPFSLWVSIHSSDASAKSIDVNQSTSCRAADGTVSTSYGWVGGPVTVADGATWTQISGTVAVPNCTVTQVQLFVEGGAGADLYVDDVQITDLSLVGNLITDGTFESGAGAWGGWGFASLAATTTSFHGGAQSLKATTLSANAAVARDIKPAVTAGKRYQATAWVSVGNLAAPGAVRLQTIQACNGAADSYPWLAGATVATGAWSQMTGIVDLTACTTIEKLLLFVGADAGDLYIDDVVLTPIQ